MVSTEVCYQRLSMNLDCLTTPDASSVVLKSKDTLSTEGMSIFDSDGWHSVSEFAEKKQEWWKDAHSKQGQESVCKLNFIGHVV